MGLDPQSRAVLDGLNGAGILPFRQSAPKDLRAKVLALRPPRPAVEQGDTIEVSEEQIEAGNLSFGVRILRPTPCSGPARPAVLYFHGGGFLFGGIDENDEMVRTIARKTGAVVFNIDYHLAPETKFPGAVNEAFAALRWVADNAARLGIDPTRIVVAGDSAGGNLTAVTCIQARERGGPSIRLQVPIYPSFDLRPSPQYPSRLTWGRGGYVLDHEDIEWMLDHYLNDRTEGDDWRASPLLAPRLAGLPPALVITADHDPLCDEGKAYADRLAAEGVKVEYVCFSGTFHGFIGYAALLDVGARGLDLVCDRIRAAVSEPAD